MANSANRDTRKADRAELARQALELRKAGASHEQIAKQLKLSNRSVAWKLIKQALKQVIAEPAADVLKLELQRLDVLLLGVWSKAKSGDTAGIDRALRIMERRASYLGLDSPKSVHFDLSRMTDEQLQQVLRGDAPTTSPAGEGGAPASGEALGVEDDAGTGA